MSQEELYQAFVQIGEKIENDTLIQFADKDTVVPFSNFLLPAMEIIRDPEKIHGISCGYQDIDCLTKGFEPGELIVVGADTGVGKSMFVQNMLHNIAKRGCPNLFFSMEMPNIEAEKRYLEMETDICDGDREKALKNIEGLPLYADSADEQNIQLLDEKIGQAIDKYGIKIVGIDHLHYFSRSQENSSAEIGYLVRQIKRIGNKYQIPILLISHLTKIKKQGMPDKSTLRDSSFIAQDADAVIMLWRDYMSDDEVKKHELFWSLQKNRTRGYLGEGKLMLTKGYKLWEGA